MVFVDQKMEMRNFNLCKFSLCKFKEGRRLVYLIFAILLPVHAFAVDFVIMKNGDRISGEVKKIWNEDVFIEPVYGDDYAIEMEHVAYIHTDAEFEVEFRRGRRTYSVIGRLDLNDDGKSVVMTSDGSTYPIGQIDNMDEIEDFFDWSVRSDLSTNVSRGNTDTTNGRFYAIGNLKLGEHRHLLEFTRDEQQTDGILLKEQTDIVYQDTWTFRDDWFVRGSLSWTRDPIRNLDSRTRLYLGPGYHFWDDSKRQMNFSLGPNYVIETIGGVEDKSNAIAFMFRYEQIFLHDDLVVFQMTDYSSIYDGRPNDVLQTSTGFRYDITDDIYLNIQLDYHFESNPASESLNEDITFLMGIGVELD